MGKPPVVPKVTPAPSVPPPAIASTDLPPIPWLHWLLEQDGSAGAIVVTWSELMQTAVGRQITPFKSSDLVDATLAEKIAAALDSVLPRLNRPDGPIRSAKRLRMVPALVDDEVQAALTGVAGLACEEAAKDVSAALGDGASGAYPTFRLVDQATHRVYYLSVAFYPMDQRGPTLPLFHIDPKAAATRLTSDGVCLLVVLEHNNKPGSELAFLNWKLIDLGQTTVRVQTAFEAATDKILLPAAVIGDGRRGRD